MSPLTRCDSMSFCVTFSAIKKTPPDRLSVPKHRFGHKQESAFRYCHCIKSLPSVSAPVGTACQEAVQPLDIAFARAQEAGVVPAGNFEQIGLVAGSLRYPSTVLERHDLIVATVDDQRRSIGARHVLAGVHFQL